MAKKVYAGVNNIAQEASKMYVGVNGVARKVNKAYVGVNNVAKEVFNGTPSVEVLDLPTAKTAHAACNVGDYVLIAGGSDTSVVTYNSSLTRGTAPSLTESDPAYMCATQTPGGSYAVFRGVNSTAYNASLTKTEIYFSYSSLRNTSRKYGAGGLVLGSFGNGVIFGNNNGGNGTTTPECYNSSLSVKTGGSGNYAGNKYIASAAISDEILKSGGMSASGSSMYSSVTPYDGSGYSSSNLTSLDYQVINHVGISNGSYALFAGGDNGSTVLTLLNAYGTDQTKHWINPLPVARNKFRIATAIAGKALICGGRMGDGMSSDRIDVIDRSLTLSMASNLIDSRYDLVACTIGDYVLVTGGTRVKPQGELTTEKVEVYDKNLNKLK